MTKTKANILLTAIITLFVAVFIVSGFMLFDYYRTAHSENEQFEQLRQIVTDRKTETDTPAETLTSADVATDSDTRPIVDNTAEPSMLPHMAQLHAINPDIAAWIRVDGTKIDYPVMYTPNEPQRYLRRAFDGSYAESGVPFIGGVHLSPTTSSSTVTT